MTKISVDDSPAPDAVDPSAVARVAARVELADIRMVWARAALNVDPAELDLQWADRAFIGYDTRADEWIGEKEGFTVDAFFVAAFRNDEDLSDVEDMPEWTAENIPDVDVAVMFSLSYRLRESAELSDEDLEHFAVFNSTFNAWPYWREIAQTVTQRMRIPPLMVPVLRVPIIRTIDDQPSK